MTHQQQFISELNNSLVNNTFVKLSLGNYNGLTESLKNCYVKKIKLKRDDNLSITYRHKTNDIVKNYSVNDGLTIINNLIAVNSFKNATLFTINFNLVFDFLKNDKTCIKKNSATQTELLSLDHNTHKNRLITPTNNHYLQQLKITDLKGNINPTAQHKYKQINHYVDLLSPLIKNLPPQQHLKVVDMGAGKGYLTFALYDYLTTILTLNATVIGVEHRKDLVDLCNDIAKKSNFNALNFVQGSIKDFDSTQTDVLIALHACDTATDDAIYKGITAQAKLIVVAPCCHKQIRRELEKHKTKNELDFLIKHGIFLERQAEMLTDGLRSLILEYYDYSTKIFEFIDGEHTAKNVMIVAEKKIKTETQKAEILSKIKQTKAFFGIEFHYLEVLMNENNSL